MNVNSLKMPIRGEFLPRLAAWQAAASRWLATTQRPDRGVVTAAQLFEMADAYEATQPSYAADLRAAARRSMRSADGAL